MAVLRANVEFAKRIMSDRVGNPYVYGGTWSATNIKQGCDCSALVADELGAVTKGTAMTWGRESEGATTESYRYIPVGSVGPFGTIRVASVRDIPANAVVKIALHHGPGGGANSHMWCEVDGVRMESAGSKGQVMGAAARAVDDSYGNAWAYLPGPIIESGTPPPPPTLSRAEGYALRIIAEGRRRGITPKGIQIALTTGIVESNITVYANSKLPKSLALPHDAVGSDGLSVGIFQQQVKDTGAGWWWGDEATCMGVESSAGLFYDRLVKLPYNGTSKTPGGFAQQVQNSAFPDRYDQHWGGAVALYNKLAGIQPPSTGDDDLTPEQDTMLRAIFREQTQRLPSRSPLRHLGEGLVDTVAGFVLNADGSTHVEVVKMLASLGQPAALALLREVAGADPIRFPDRQEDAKLAMAILSEVTSPAAVMARPVSAPAPAHLGGELADAVAENARLRDEISRLNMENIRLQAATQAPVEAPALPALVEPTNGHADTTGALIGRVYDSLEELRLADALPIESRAPLAALIAVLNTKNGSQLS